MADVNWAKIRREAREEYNRIAAENPNRHSSFDASEALELVATRHGVGYGIEGFCDQSSGRHGVTYINTGDAYTTTVCFESDFERFSVTSYGNIIEAHPRWYS